APGLRRSRDDREHLASGDSTPAFVLRAVDSLELAFGLLELVPHAKNRRAEELPPLFGEAIGRLAAVVEDRLLDRPELLHDRPKRLLVVLGSRPAQTREDGPKRRDGRGMRRDLPPARVRPQVSLVELRLRGVAQEVRHRDELDSTLEAREVGGAFEDAELLLVRRSQDDEIEIGDAVLEMHRAALARRQEVLVRLHRPFEEIAIFENAAVRIDDVAQGLVEDDVPEKRRNAI